VGCDSQLAENSRRIQAAVWRAAVLTQRLFDLSGSVSDGVLELPRALDEVLNLARMAAGERVEIQIVSAPETWTVSADPAEFGRAILNLIINGAQSIDEEGTVVVKTINTVLSEGQSSKLCLGRREFVQIQVTDSGRGMTAATMARAFEPHFTTKPGTRGTGLGLAQVRAFIQRSGGAIEATSDLGAGTTMSMYLPRADREAPHGDTSLRAG